jgi:hypothetical protein
MTTCYKLQLKSDWLLCRLGFQKMGARLAVAPNIESLIG